MAALLRSPAIAGFYTRLLFPRSYSDYVYLRNSQNNARLYLVGIDHISPKSVDLVRNVELCVSRFYDLFRKRKAKAKEMRFWDIFRNKGGLRQNLITYVIHNVYARLEEKGFKAGEELKAAVLEGQALGAEIHFIDQNYQVTMNRAGQLFSLKEVVNFLVDYKTMKERYPNFYRAICHDEILRFVEALGERSAIEEAMELLEKYFPQLGKAFVHERNAIMVQKLRQMSGCIVCVVGKLHVDGMHKLWDEDELHAIQV